MENSQYFQKHIPRGELIELLSKALLYLEVEAHWRNNALTTNCKSGFSLLEPHICSLEEAAVEVPPDSPDVQMEENTEQENVQERQSVSRPVAAPSLPSASTAPVPATSQVKIPLPTRNGSMSHIPKPVQASVPKEDTIMSEQNPPLAEGESNIKRKTSPVQAEGREEKRPRHGSAEMEVDTDSERLLSLSRIRRLTDIQSYSITIGAAQRNITVQLC